MIFLWEYNYTNYDVLIHYGIKGQKWGIRRYQNEDGTLTSAGKKRAARQEMKAARKEEKAAIKAEKKDREQAAKNRRSLSNDELASRVKRLEQEKKLKQLTAEDVAPGRTAVLNFLKTTGGRVLTSAVVGGLIYAGHYAMTGKFDPQQAANYIFPNPNKKK